MIQRIQRLCMTGAKLLILGTLVASFALVGGTAVQAVELTVTSTTDAVDANPGDGLCATKTGTCTLRAAVQEANARDGGETIVLQSGTYTLTVEGAGTEIESAYAGDLDTISPLHIRGQGPAATYIDAKGKSRAFEIYLGDNQNLDIEGVTITGGWVPSVGGAMSILASDTSTVTIKNSKITGNFTTGDGGGILLNGGTLKIVDSSITNNEASGQGGGIYVMRGHLLLERTIIEGNNPDDCFGCQ